MQIIQVHTEAQKQFINISSQLQNLVSKEGWRDGVLTVYVPHTTAGVTINEKADPDVPRDIFQHVQKLVPREADFAHGEGNSDAHILSSFFGSSQQVIVENGKLQFGTWQSVFFCEFDGPRKRNVWLEFTPAVNTTAS